MLPTPRRLTPTTDGPDRNPGSWPAWLALLAAVLPLGLSIASVQHVLAEEELLQNYPVGDGTVELQFVDRWSTVLSLASPSWPALTTATALVVLAAVVLSGRPRWLVVPHGRAVVASAAAVCAAWAGATAVLALWTLFADPSPRLLLAAEQGWTPMTVQSWGLEGAAALVAVVLGLAVLATLVTTRPSHPRVVEDAPESAQPE